jgi:Icc-related predicted phosphoesterase
MRRCFFASDLHGRSNRYQALFSRIEAERPDAVFLGGDLLPPFGPGRGGRFIKEFLAGEFSRLRDALGEEYPRVFLIPGNDDSFQAESELMAVMEKDHLWEYLQGQKREFSPYTVFGYAFVPPTPFLNKDWERYDNSRYLDPGCVAPEEGWRSREVPDNLIQHATIKQDLLELAGTEDLSAAIFLFHAPPYQTKLDRAALDGKVIDHVPLDLHVGSIAIRDFILSKQPLITLHGHVHESARLTGSWQDRLGNTFAFTAAHDGPELALVCFDPADPQRASRNLY